ncbi:class I SAM-dependent DNA methyltransferase [Sedimentibacter sp. MB31-C6]|uniref:class I SAM-dependent DNA methyltransferase n=1 Tax=Sedimentibacter sp. MB31-C6 TaxID=3109366 RepID=UPI002DDD53B7|nr:class I SAM-dependent methyltransferase [Sedimentibacter sp. MB36-C1]WSI02904.1 class I SAM-dependent methyltransferase [Sedimentibacter sp. MB36-C1]
MKSTIWNFWAKRYDKLWVQKYSLKPTRNYILKAMNEIMVKEHTKVLDLGCGPGQLINELSRKYNNLDIMGIDFSEKMLEVSKSRNPLASHIKLDVSELYKLKEKFNIIVCTHSLPYYKEPNKVMRELSKLLKDGGRIFLGFASGNNFYDKFALSFVKLTTGPATYPSHKEFEYLISPYFQIENVKVIKEKFYMPRIAIYTLKKVNQ